MTFFLWSNKIAAMKAAILNLFVYFPLIISTFFLAIRIFYVYILPRIQQYYKPTNQLEQNNMNKIESLIEQTKGRFFSLTFRKLDGTIRTINSKDKYNRLIVGTGSPATDALKERGFKNAVNRNKESWFSFKPENILEFKCGSIHETF